MLARKWQLSLTASLSLLPNTCLLCDERVTDAANLCLYCCDDLLNNQQLTLFDDLKFNPNARNNMKLDALDLLWVGFHYQWPIDHWISQFKYRYHFAAEKALLELWFRALSQTHISEQLAEFDCLLCVPCHWWRQFRRGFNQLAGMASLLSAEYDLLDYSAALQRCRHTQAQAGLSAAKRRRNLANAFMVKPSEQAKGLFNGNKVLLLDDVVTTGTTLNQVAKLLKQQGASQVVGLTLAWAEFV